MHKVRMSKLHRIHDWLIGLGDIVNKNILYQLKTNSSPTSRIYIECAQHGAILIFLIEGWECSESFDN